MPIQTINPATGNLVKSFQEDSPESVNETIIRTHAAFEEWRTTTYDLRKKAMLNASYILKKNSEEYGKILTLEMGKTITEAIAEVEKCAWVCEYYAENSEEILKKEIVSTDAAESYVQFDPLGVVLAVMPWNFPFWQVFRFAAPALMAGNTALLKHASNVPQSALLIERIFREAGFPDYTFKTLLIGSSAVEEVIKHPFVKAATLTGSDPAGRKVAGTCGRYLKKTVMELGGSDPFIVLNDADICHAVDTAVKARLINNGQSCIAAKRFIVTKDVYNEFAKKFVDKMKLIITGDPMDKNTELGPIAREDLLNELINQVKRSVEMGAELLCGGERINRKGFFFQATVIGNIKPGMPAYDEELFGPVASLIKVKDEEEAVKVANETEFGLGAAVFTRNIKKAKQIASSIEAGSVFINGMVKSDPRLPFGGVKLSGYGRELSHYGIKEFVNIKSVWIK
ncbi:MAG: NAD-dependent succinate-semialdehyde dehydrogenase [Melioribacteraceae bacterium]|nr:NAD-dependent succinate-semialdehyde dehydrogenase [Melioribacteraceae bacterium]